jgi:demethylmacrocin O-methyltransferase
MTLDEIAIKYNTDKQSKLHNYTEKYSNHLEKLRNDKIKILEIGIQNGYSLKTWKEYFPNAEIYGIDIVDCSQMNEERIKTLKGSQTDLGFLAKITEEYGPFDIIIDDGSHYSLDMKISFDFLFPTLKKGGLYIVEDLHCIYWPEFKDGGNHFMKRLRKLADSVNGHGKWGLAEISNSLNDHVYNTHKYGKPNWWDKNVEWITQYRSIVFIKKSNHGTEFTPNIKRPFKLYANFWRFASKAYRKIKEKLLS